MLCEQPAKLLGVLVVPGQALLLEVGPELKDLPFLGGLLRRLERCRALAEVEHDLGSAPLPERLDRPAEFLLGPRAGPWRRRAEAVPEDAEEQVVLRHVSDLGVDERLRVAA